ncbi:uncharacterized protein LOC124284288 [Haliotis rubra]|uniref:uncharacterized protein LOC124284288 n=1 Tax=Haliotis rubra TaxID=36100 RepID=UPI001EE53D39|nr:uncharacterized protein LOC124284288 [Haliotis rubra]
MSSLATDQVTRVNSKWVLRSGDVSEAYIKHLITTLPSTCLYNREGALLGYALTYHYGCLGVLYVLEEHRGNGYGKVAMSQLALKHLQKKKEVFVMIQCVNVASIKMHEAIGFEGSRQVTTSTSWFSWSLTLSSMGPIQLMFLVVAHLSKEEQLLLINVRL